MALLVAKAAPIDLVLLDINMPEMDGYQVCELFKSDKKLKQIPIIFISANSDTIDKVKAFKAGGVDYITKPFQLEEVQARVKTHIELYQLRRQLEKQNNYLKGMVIGNISEYLLPAEKLRGLIQK